MWIWGRLMMYSPHRSKGLARGALQGPLDEARNMTLSQISWSEQPVAHPDKPLVPEALPPTPHPHPCPATGAATVACCYISRPCCVGNPNPMPTLQGEGGGGASARQTIDDPSVGR